jgi:methyl-accepting chemotaxis protein
LVYLFSTTRLSDVNSTMAAVNIGFGVTLLMGLIGIGAVIVLTLSVNRRLQELLESVKNIADDETDLTRRVIVGHNEDEVGIAANALNTYLDTVTNIFESFRQASTRLHTAVGNISHLATQTQQHVVEAGASIDHAVTAIAEVADSATRVTGSAEHTSLSTNDANLQSQAGSAVVARSIEAINSLTANVEDAARGAARAGEHGRGFAVVADTAQQQRTSADALGNGMAHVNEVTQIAVALINGSCRRRRRPITWRNPWSPTSCASKRRRRRRLIASLDYFKAR